MYISAVQKYFASLGHKGSCGKVSPSRGVVSVVMSDDDTAQSCVLDILQYVRAQALKFLSLVLIFMNSPRATCDA